MVEINNEYKQCTICRKEYTAIYTEAYPGVKVYVCDKCLETAKHSFIFICMECGQVYVRPKKVMIERLNNFELKRAYMLCEDMQIIQGIEICVQCDPSGIMEYMNNERAALC